MRHPSATRLLKLVAVSILPEPVLYRLWRVSYQHRRRSSLGTARGLRIVKPQAGVELEVYWSDVPGVGSGPSASLFVLGEEVLRFDCFGGPCGHMHLNPEQVKINLPSGPRLYFPEGSRADHIERAVFELSINAVAAARLNKLARVRTFPVDMSALGLAARQMAREMDGLLITRGDASAIAHVYVSPDLHNIRTNTNKGALAGASVEPSDFDVSD